MNPLTHRITHSQRVKYIREKLDREVFTLPPPPAVPPPPPETPETPSPRVQAPDEYDPPDWKSPEEIRLQIERERGVLDLAPKKGRKRTTMLGQIEDEPRGYKIRSEAAFEQLQEMLGDKEQGSE